MGKQGPCYHCGVTSTPLWRNGPPEKPVLCNACGSRWRTKGTLANYTPLHARPESDDFEDYRISKVKPMSVKNKEAKGLKRKMNNDMAEYGITPPDHSDGFRKVVDEDTSNRSSSGSAISNSESCAQYGSVDASDWTGPSQPIIWDTMVPSRKRTCTARPKQSPVEKLTKDLYTIWHEQQSSCLSGSSEEDLLLESNKPMVSVEIGHGSVLIRHPSSIAREEESEASSLSVDKQNTVLSRPMTVPGIVEDTGANSSIRGISKTNKPINQEADQDRTRRDRDQLEKLHILAHHNSPLCFIDLQEVLNFENFSNYLTYDEQQQMQKFLPSLDSSETPERDSAIISNLKSMFDSPQFKENLLSFQRLLANGVFDNSFHGVNSEDCRTLKKLILCSSTKSKWVEKYKILEDLKDKSNISGSEVVGRFTAPATDQSGISKKLRDGQQQKFTGSKSIMKSPRRIIMNSNDDGKEPRDKHGSSSGAKGLLSLQKDNSSMMPVSSHFADDSSDQDLLLDVPSNSSFPQAELLLPASSFGGQASTSSSSVYPNLLRH